MRYLALVSLMMRTLIVVFLFAVMAPSLSVAGPLADLLKQWADRQQQQDDTPEPTPEPEPDSETITITRQLLIDGKKRTYILYAPVNYGSYRPLVIAFHGAGGRPMIFASRMFLREMADEHGYVLALPKGVRKSWNADSLEESASGYAERTNINDIGFVQAIIYDARAQASMGPDVYLMGMSKGGMMAYHAACEIDDIDKIAVVAGTLSSEDCTSLKEVDLLHIHGTKDENVPFDGGRGQYTGGDTIWPPVKRGLDLWRKKNGVGPPTLKRAAQDTLCTVEKSNDGKTRMEVCLVTPGGHAWPGIEPSQRQIDNDIYVSPHFIATDYIAEFFNGG